jgi:hypothetical protein
MIMLKRALLIAILPVLAVVVVTAALIVHPSHASAESLVPFQASVSETYTAAPCGQWSRCITAVGQGQATHLGEITENATVVVDTNPADAQNGCAPETRTTTLTAANGDQIMMSGTGFSCNATSDAHDNYVISGGTERFQGASGSGNEYNVHTFTGPGMGVATVTYNGTISSVGSLNS